MTPEAFNAWLVDMKSAGLARSAADCARLMGVSLNSVYAMKREGVKGPAGVRTALACRALLEGLEPYDAKIA